MQPPALPLAPHHTLVRPSCSATAPAAFPHTQINKAYRTDLPSSDLEIPEEPQPLARAPLLPNPIPHTLLRPSCSATAATLAWMRSGGVSAGSRREAWKVRYSHTVDVPGSTTSCCTYLQWCVYMCMRAHVCSVRTHARACMHLCVKCAVRQLYTTQSPPTAQSGNPQPFNRRPPTPLAPAHSPHQMAQRARVHQAAIDAYFSRRSAAPGTAPQQPTACAMRLASGQDV